MKNISFDNPYILLLAIPLSLIVIIPFFISRNKDNRNKLWTSSLIIHLAIILLAVLAAAGLTSTRVMTKTEVYVLCDVSYSSDGSLDEIDAYIEEISKNMPSNSSLGVVCFGKNSIVLTPLGREIKSVSLAKVDNSATDIVSALNYTGGLFKGDTLKRIILITDGNDTVTESRASIASAVERLTESGIKIDAIFLDNSPKENDTELQLLDAEFKKNAYSGHENEAKFLIQSTKDTDVVLELYSKPHGRDDSAYEKIGATVVPAESGLTTVRLPLLSKNSGTFDYKATISKDGDISEFNNTIIFSQTVVGSKKLLHVAGTNADLEMVEALYGAEAEIDSYLAKGSGSSVPFTVDALAAYDEIILSNVDVRNIKNANAFINSLDIAVSQFGKTLITFGDLRIQSNSEDKILNKLSELLPVKFGDTGTDGRLYTIVLDVSHSMFMASKFTTAKQTAISLLSILEDEDYVCLVTFSGEIRVETPKKVKNCKEELISFIDSLSTDHGTELGLGLEEALKTVRGLRLTENRVMVISDGFSFDSERAAEEVAAELYAEGATVSAVNTFVNSDGTAGSVALRKIVNAGTGGNYYEITSPEKVSSVVFGDLANDVGAVIIEKDVEITVSAKDKITEGITSLPVISGFIVSRKSYDAIAPLTITYLKDNGYQENVPFYAYRAHGNGKIASFTGSLSGKWAKLWDNDSKAALLTNLFLYQAPSERIDRPFTLTVERDSFGADLTLSPSSIDPNATATLKLTTPDNRTVTRSMPFNTAKYTYSFDTRDVGTYVMEITYTVGDVSYTATESFSISYLPEYDAFQAFDKFTVYDILRGCGTLTVGGIPDLDPDESEITTYRESYVIPLLAISVALFVIDVFIRKLRVSKKSSSKGKEKK